MVGTPMIINTNNLGLYSLKDNIVDIKYNNFINILLNIQNNISNCIILIYRAKKIVR